MEVLVPDLGDFADVDVIEILVRSGDRVEKEDSLITLETDKATMDVPSPAAGTVGELKIGVGDRVSAGDPILLLDAEEPAAADARAEPGAAPSPDPGADGGEPEPPAVAEPAPDAANIEPRTVTVPDLGDFSDVEIIEVLVSPGDRVEAEQGLVTLETEKATMDVPAPGPGTVLELAVAVGDRVSTGDAVLVMRPSAPPKTAERAVRAAAARSPEPASPGRAAPEAPAQTSAERRPAAAGSARASAASRATAVNEAGFSVAHASPSVRKLARELGVDLGRVRGSGRKGRVTADDVKAFVKEILTSGGTGLPAVPAVDFAKYGKIDVEPLTRIQRISGPRLQASWINVPHVTQHDEADITELEQTRRDLKARAEERGVRLTPLAFVVRACALMLAEFPQFKASLAADGEHLVKKHYTHIGFAADTPQGLLVPVIRDADKKDVFELADALGTLSARAREGKLGAADMQGGVFTVSSLGGIGGRFFTPIINAPEVAILGVSRSQRQPVYRGDELVPRLMLPLSLSYDHRVIDGATAVRFTTRLVALLADVERLLETTP